MEKAGSWRGSARRHSSPLQVLPLLCAALLCAWAPPARAGLLRVPRVYNALITTDERLLPSRAVSVSAPLLGAPLVIGPAPAGAVLPHAAPALPFAAPAVAPAASPAAAPATKAADEPKQPAQKASESAVQEKAAAVPAAPAIPAAPASLPSAVLPLYSPYYSYYPSLLPYSLAPHPVSPLLFFNPFLPAAAPFPAPGSAPAPEAPADPSGRALPPGAKDEPEKEAVSVEAN